MTLSEFIRSDESIKRLVYLAVIEDACAQQKESIARDRDGI